MLGIQSFLQCCYLHIPHGSAKKTYPLLSIGGKQVSFIFRSQPNYNNQVQAVVEVKCLFTWRKDKIHPEQNFKFLREENHKIVLDVGHQYYDQVQGQMYISGSAKCFFVVHFC